MTGEIHLFLIWSKAMQKVDEIISQINNRFGILDIYLMHWSERHFSDNLSRFYGTNLPDGSFKEKHCGRGNFCVVVVHDPSPVYDICQTSSGKQNVNTNMFHTKELLRSITGGGHRVHATNSPTETTHDLMLLLEKDCQDYMTRTDIAWDGQVKAIERDLPGADGWRSIEQLFRVLNASTPYLVMRNFEGLPHDYFVDNHGDIDLLCSDMENMRYLCNAKPIFKEAQRVLHKVKISGNEVLFDFRFVGDNYYDKKWQQDLLERRELVLNCFYGPSVEDHFYSLLYHAAIQKPVMKEDYIDKLCELSKGYENITPDDLRDPGKIKTILDRYLNRHGYQYTEPKDASVFFNNALASTEKISLNRIVNSSPTKISAIRQILNQAANCATDSPEFCKEIYTTHPLLKRHFSERRYTILKHLPLEGIENVLELGAESGMLTRYLGENFNHVIALESETELAQCAKIRCQDQPHVAVRNNLEDLKEIGSSFDLIISTNDCKKLYHQGRTIQDLTRSIKYAIDLLAPDGVLILSIDNPLARNGFYNYSSALSSIDDRAPGDLKSLLADDIKTMMTSQGMAHIDAYYMFPDHLNPRTIINESIEALKLKAFGYWAGSAFEREEDTSVDMALAGELSHAGRIGEMAGGICIVATKKGCPKPEMPWKIFSYSNAARPRQTQTITTLSPGNDLTVIKTGETIHQFPFIFNPNMHYPVYDGCLVDAALIHQLFSGSLSRVVGTMKQIAVYWLKSQLWTEEKSMFPHLIVSDDHDISGDALDAISRNLIVSDGKINFFDNEWRSEIPIPMSFLLYRSILNLFSYVKPETVFNKLLKNNHIEKPSLDELILHLINQIGIIKPLNVQDILIFKQFEKRFQQFAYSGKLTQENPSLLELYQTAKLGYANNDAAKLQNSVRLLKKLYHNMPIVIQMMSLIDAGSSPGSPRCIEEKCTVN